MRRLCRLASFRDERGAAGHVRTEWHVLRLRPAKREGSAHKEPTGGRRRGRRDLARREIPRSVRGSAFRRDRGHAPRLPFQLDRGISPHAPRGRAAATVYRDGGVRGEAPSPDADRRSDRARRAARRARRRSRGRRSRAPRGREGVRNGSRDLCRGEAGTPGVSPLVAMPFSQTGGARIGKSIAWSVNATWPLARLTVQETGLTVSFVGLTWVLPKDSIGSLRKYRGFFSTG